MDDLDLRVDKVVAAFNQDSDEDEFNDEDSSEDDKFRKRDSSEDEDDKARSEEEDNDAREESRKKPNKKKMLKADVVSDVGKKADYEGDNVVEGVGQASLHCSSSFLEAMME